MVFTTLADKASAEDMATRVLEEHLAACVHILPAGRSIYRWQGTLEHAEEVTLMIKTTEAAFEPLKARLLVLHPYELPEIVALPIRHGDSTYLQWIADQCVGALR